MANIRLTRAAVHTTDPGTGVVTDTPPLAMRVPHTAIDAVCAQAEGESDMIPTARSLAMLDFGAGPMVIGFDEAPELIRGLIRALPGGGADEWAELASPSGGATFFRRSGYVACQAQEDEGDGPRTLVWFRPRGATAPKTFVVAATDDQVEDACAAPAAPTKTTKSTRKQA